MNGVINVYKPCGITSFDVVRDIKKLCKVKRVGHTGTLDPLASGVLPVCIGKGTKVVDYIMNNRKVYIAELKLGVVTDTYDREGKVIEENNVHTDEKDVISAINSFIGEIEQIPPMYSALKINGKKLYELARQGIEVERQARKINIYRINILSLKLPYAVIEIECSKGTYIRSLCYDIGRKLGCGAVMWNLERTATGNFNKCEAIQLDKLNEDNINDYIIPLEKIFREYEKIHLDSKFGKLALNGVCIKDKRLLSQIDYEVFYRVYIDDDKFIGLGKKSSKGFKIDKLLI